MKKVAVVVTYNRALSLKKCIQHLLQQTIKLDNIYIIDNCSRDNTREIVEGFKNDRIKYYCMKSNLGGAGGFYYGIKYAIDDGADSIWGMDDDAFPKENAYEILLSVYKEYKEKKGKNICLWSNCNQDKQFEGKVKEVNTWMFVGFFITRDIVKKIGLPRKDFFIYQDDGEYAHRIRKSGIEILKVRDSVIIHKDSMSDYIEKRIGPFKIKRANLSDWKFYYQVRNYILMFKWNELEKYITIFLKMPKIFIWTLLFNKKQINIFLKAFFHGIFGYSGKIIDPEKQR